MPLCHESNADANSSHLLTTLALGIASSSSTITVNKILIIRNLDYIFHILRYIYDYIIIRFFFRIH